MRFFLVTILFCVLNACVPAGYRNLEIKNLASPNIKIEGMKYERGRFLSVKYKEDPSVFIGISDPVRVVPLSGLTKEPKFQEISMLKIYYKSKACLLFYLDERNNDIFHKKHIAFVEKKILTLTNKGLEILTKEEYEIRKGQYTINDSNVKCLNNI